MAASSEAGTTRRPDEEQLAERLWDAGLRAEVASRVARDMLAQASEGTNMPDPWLSAHLGHGAVLWIPPGVFLTAGPAPTVSTGRIEAL